MGNFSILLARDSQKITASYSSPPRDEHVFLSSSFSGDVTSSPSNEGVTSGGLRDERCSDRDHRHRLTAVLEETLHTLLSITSSHTHLRAPSTIHYFEFQRHFTRFFLKPRNSLPLIPSTLLIINYTTSLISKKKKIVTRRK